MRDGSLIAGSPQRSTQSSETHPLCLKNRRAAVRQGKNRRKSGVYEVVNEHFKPIFNAVWPSADIFQAKRRHGMVNTCPTRKMSLSSPLACFSAFMLMLWLAATWDNESPLWTRYSLPALPRP
jgi:hypothetical protein